MLMPRAPSSFPSSTEGPHGPPPTCRPSFCGSGSQAFGTKHGGTALLMYPVSLPKGWFSNVWPLLAPFVRAGPPAQPYAPGSLPPSSPAHWGTQAPPQPLGPSGSG